MSTEKITIPRYEDEFAWNVVSEGEFKNKTVTVFERVASALAKTLGPYGSTTIIEKFGDLHITKDGWQLLKKIKFGDTTNDAILQLLVNISAQVVIKVGDGSTSSIIASDELLKAINANEILKSMRPKDLLDSINRVVNIICETIESNAIQVDKSDNATYEDIRNIALISTNGEEEIADMIQKIYIETGNPAIEFVKSKNNVTKMEIVNGYKMPFMNYIDGIFINNENGTCDIKSPCIIMFDHKVDREYYDTIISAMRQKAMQEQRKLVVIAPYFDNYLLDRLRKELNMQYNKLGETLEVYVRIGLINNHMSDLYNDFAALCGATIINEVVMDEILDREKEVSIQDIWDMNLNGTVEKMSIGDKTTFITGFINKDENKYELLLNDALSKYKDREESDRGLNIVTDETFKLKQRISKLRGTMGSISVGGNSELEKSANFDLVEDAVKACESAYNYGYNIGQNIAIHKAIACVLFNDEAELSETDIEIINTIGKAFANVLRRVIENKREITEEALGTIISKGINEDVCFDLISEQFTKSVINSCRTDIEILKATTSIIGLLMSSNQYISIAIQ